MVAIRAAHTLHCAVLRLQLHQKVHFYTVQMHKNGSGHTGSNPAGAAGAAGAAQPAPLESNTSAAAVAAGTGAAAAAANDPAADPAAKAAPTAGAATTRKAPLASEEELGRPGGCEAREEAPQGC